MQGLVPSPPKVIQKSQAFTILNAEAAGTLLVLGLTSAPWFCRTSVAFFSPQSCKRRIKETQEDGNKDESPFFQLISH